jgi:hypothetical protein
MFIPKLLYNWWVIRADNQIERLSKQLLYSIMFGSANSFNVGIINDFQYDTVLLEQ